MGTGVGTGVGTGMGTGVHGGASTLNRGNSMGRITTSELDIYSGETGERLDKALDESV